MKTTEMLKKQLAVAVTAALLALPLGTTLALADTDTSVVSTDTTSVDMTRTGTTNPDIEDTEATSVVDSEGNEVDPADWLSDLIVKLQTALTFDPVRKCELNERYALAKLAKAQKLMTEGKTEKCQIALNEYTDKITKAEEFLEQVEDTDSEEAKKLTIALTNVNQNNIKVLGELLDKLPPQAAQKLALNVVRSMEKAVTKIEKQEAKAAIVTPPVTDSETTPANENKYLKEQAKVALKEFRKSLKQKGSIHLEDQDDENREDKDKDDVASTQKPPMTNSQPTSVTVAPAKLHPAQTGVRVSEQGKGDRNKQDEKSKDREREDSRGRGSEGNKSGDREDNKGWDKKDR